MTTSDAGELPNVAEILGAVLQRVPREQQPLLVAIAERMAAERYRGWAKEVGSDEPRSLLLECAKREEEIAGRVEAVHPDAAAVQREILAKNPDVAEITRGLFADRPLHEQLAIQARGERLGASIWRSFAGESSGRQREAFEGCAPLEEANAVALETLLAGRS